VTHVTRSIQDMLATAYDKEVYQFNMFHFTSKAMAVLTKNNRVTHKAEKKLHTYEESQNMCLSRIRELESGRAYNVMLLVLLPPTAGSVTR